MSVKLLKLNANDEISSGAVEMSSSGSVTERHVRQRPAPSIFAASMTSDGSDWSAPVQMRNMYGKPSHRFTNRTENFARTGSVSHGISAPPKMTSLMKP